MNPATVGAEQAHKTHLAAYGARLRREKWLAYRVAWCRDESVGTRRELWAMLMNDAAGFAKDWGKVPKGILSRMVHLAIDELATPIPGSGWRVRADRLEVSKNDWFRLWRRRYERIYSQVADWENCAFSHVWRMQR